MKRLLKVALAAAVWASGAAGAYAQEETAAPQSFEDLRTLYEETGLLVLFEAEAVQARPEVDTRRVWEVRGTLLEVVKGTLAPGAISVHVHSVVRAFQTSRDEMPKRRFVAALKPLSEAAERRFELVGQRAFAAEGEEANALRQLAAAEAQRGSGGKELRLQIRPVEKAFPVRGPKTILVRLTNDGKESATYLQEPLTERNGKLYLMGDGMLRVRDLSGRIVPDKGNIIIGQAPPPPPTPALVLPRANHDKTVDLAKYFDLSEGRYTLVLTLATPDGRGRIPSNGLSFQVGVVDLPEPPERSEEKAVIVIESSAPEPPAGQIAVPEPGSYKPGRAVLALAGLLRPSKARYALGEPVEVEFRLINKGPRAVSVDARLERALTVQVQPVGDSPEPALVRQVILWPADPPGLPEARAYLRAGAFWGRTLNLNILYGKSREALQAPTPEEITAGKDLTYGRFARRLFGFPKPGTYKVTATYRVRRPETKAGEIGPATRTWWTGTLETNSITIQIVEERGR